MLMKKEGFLEVYQIQGGIVKYGEEFKDEGLWEGSLYVFDGRMNIEFSDQAKVIGRCSHCRQDTSNYENCRIDLCDKLILTCSECVINNNLICQNCVSTVEST